MTQYLIVDIKEKLKKEILILEFLHFYFYL